MFHLLLHFFYQFPRVHRLIRPEGTLARLLGLARLVSFSCDRFVYRPQTNSWMWPEYVQPFVLLALYAITTLQLRTCHEEKDVGDEEEAIGDPPSVVVYETDLSCDLEKHGARGRRGVYITRPAPSQSTTFLSQLVTFVKSQSYVLTLLTMMAWSLTYHSWLTFVLLILSCAVWMHPRSQQFCFHIAPLVGLYACILLLSQFVFSLNLTQAELPDEHPPFLRQIGFEKPRSSAPFVHLSIKGLFTALIFLTVRQRGVDEELEPGTPKKKDSTFAGLHTPKFATFLEKAKKIISEYWLVVNLCLLLAISLQAPVVLYRLIYMSFFLLFLNIFQLSFPFWRRTLRVFMMCMVAYCMLVLTLIYTFQFHGVPEIYHTYLTPQMVLSLGLEKISTSELLVKLLTPISFLVFTLIQVNFFHEKLMQRTEQWETVLYNKRSELSKIFAELHRQTEMRMDFFKMHIEAIRALREEKSDKSESPSEKDSSAGNTVRVRMKIYLDKIERKCQKIVSSRGKVVECVWRVLEMHADTLLAAFMLGIACHEICLSNLLYVHCVCAWLRSPAPTSPALPLTLLSPATAVFVIAKMAMQMEAVQEENITVHCESVHINGSFPLLEWLGLRKAESMVEYVKPYLVVSILFSLRAVVMMRQRLRRHETKEKCPPRGVLFPSINRVKADQSVANCLMYLANFWFYKFGLEVCHVLCVVSIGLRCDAIGVMYGVILLYFLCIDRERIGRQWRRYTVFLSVSVVAQYMMCLGIPKLFCTGYPWYSWDSNLLEWLFLPDHATPPDSSKILYDFVFLIAVSTQQHVFEIEQSSILGYPGGSNRPCVVSYSLIAHLRAFIKKERLELFHSEKVHISVCDFISEQLSFLDQLKTILFMYFYWVTLAVVFIAGTSQVTLFAMGYVFGCFLFLWVGNSLFLKPIAICLKLWDILTLYNFCVIFIKTTLQVVGCVYMTSLSTHCCWLMQLLGIACLKAGHVASADPSTCSVPFNQAGVFYDALCFVFLLIQRRVFASEYYKHVIAEFKSQHYFASRGAELIAKITVKEVREAAEAEEELIAKVKRKMERIRHAHTRDEGRADDEPLSPLPDMNSPTESVVSKKSNLMSIPRITVLGASTSTVGEAEQETEHVEKEKQREFKEREDPFNKWRSISFYGDLRRDRKRSVYDESDDDWCPPQQERLFDPKITSGEGGVKGLGPLQLLNYAFKKGAIKEALKESDEIEATHAKLEKEMQQTFGIADHGAIRRAIFRRKSKKTKADFDEATFNEDALTRDAGVAGGNMEHSRRKKALAEMMRRHSAYHVDFGRKMSIVGSSDIPDDLMESIPNEDEIKQTIDAMAVVEMFEQQQKKKSTEEDEEVGEKGGRLAEVRVYVRDLARNVYVFACLFGRGVVESVIASLMRMSRDHRYVAFILQQEKRNHKELFHVDDDAESPTSHTSQSPRGTSRASQLEEYSALQTIKEESSKESVFGRDDTLNSIAEFQRMEDVGQEQVAVDYLIVRLVKAVYHLLLSRSELICYFMIVLNHMHSASLLSMPLPLLTFLWGTLSVPRPSKRFWITIITYTQLMVIVKYCFQYGFWSWNGVASADPFWPPRLLGIERSDMYAAWDLALLMTLFLHRNILMTNGLWHSALEQSTLISKMEEKTERERRKEREKEEKAEKTAEDVPTLVIESPSSQNKGIKEFFEHKLRFRTKRGKRSEEEPNSQKPSLTVPPCSHSSSRRSSISTIAEKTADLRHMADISKQRIRSKMFERMSSARAFFSALLDPQDRFPVDMYAPMFLCDVICFLVVIFGYSSFGTDHHGGDVTAYFSSNKVPATLVSMLILQFVLIVFDRALFLRKFLVGKLVFQIVLVILTHVWMFLLLPAATDRLFTQNTVCKLWYFTKVVYLIISAKQIRSGYPRRSLGNIITNSYTAINWLLYKLFMLCPFLFELRCLMDWIWMDTSLGVGDWFMLNDIYSHISMLKCERNIEEDYPSPKGVAKRPMLKYGLGGVLLAAIVLIIWFPLVLFSMANTVGIRSLPVECTLKLSIAGYQPLFESTAQLDYIRELSDSEYEHILHTYRFSKGAQSYMTDYSREDIVRAEADADSATRWTVSPPARRRLAHLLQHGEKVSIKLEWNWKRAPDENLQFGKVEDFLVLDLPKDGDVRRGMLDAMQGNNTQQIRIHNLFPAMLKVPGEGKSQPVSELLGAHLKNDTAPIAHAFYDALLSLHSYGDYEWWRIRMVDPQFDPLRKSEEKVLDHLVILGFVDKVFPVTFSFITGGGILGLYFSMVLVFGRFMRMLVTGAMQRIMFEELPCVDRVLQLCLDIFLVREAGELSLEEDLTAKLVFLFRSPATLIKWTRSKTQ